MKQRIITLAMLLFCIATGAFAINRYFFYIQLKDKNNTGFTLSNPSAYLSADAIARRTRFGIAIDSTDLPVHPSYINSIKALGITIHSLSKWTNGVTVIVPDSSVMSQVRSLSFVKRTQFTGIYSGTNNVRNKVGNLLSDSLNYNYSYSPLQQLNGLSLHRSGFTGKNVKVAILDAGFASVNTNAGFDSLRLQNRLLGVRDFTESVPNIYGSDVHGANVLSFMAGNMPGTYIGASPHASYWLIRTEYGPTEYLCETDFWTAGAEFADSVGVDIINSSLGYSTFDDATMNFRYQDMTGMVSRASRAATLAAQKGIIVCVSAGNSGNKTWHYIGSPADAKEVVTVGAATGTGDAAAFSSYGPTYDRRIKPDISANGSSTNYINTSGAISSGSGTSYSSPLIAGMFACMVQYAKEKMTTYKPQTLIEAVKNSASLYPFPTAQLGYGIPDFGLASASLTTSVAPASDTRLSVVYNRGSGILQLISKGEIIRQISVTDATGRIVCRAESHSQTADLNTNLYASGIYIVRVKTDTGVLTNRFVIP